MAVADLEAPHRDVGDSGEVVVTVETDPEVDVVRAQTNGVTSAPDSG
jgi:hypothetical protein